MIGILVVWGLTIFVTRQYDFVMTMSMGNIMRGADIRAGRHCGRLHTLAPGSQDGPVEAMNQH